MRGNEAHRCEHWPWEVYRSGNEKSCPIFPSTGWYTENYLENIAPFYITLWTFGISGYLFLINLSYRIVITNCTKYLTAQHFLFYCFGYCCVQCCECCCYFSHYFTQSILSIIYSRIIWNTYLSFYTACCIILRFVPCMPYKFCNGNSKADIPNVRLSINALNFLLCVL